jgi:hypothetical protein
MRASMDIQIHFIEHATCFRSLHLVAERSSFLSMNAKLLPSMFGLWGRTRRSAKPLPEIRLRARRPKLHRRSSSSL